jgi:very-short-patch-repair endonuclease
MHKYGVANVFQNKSIQEKQKSTINKIYGVDNVFQNESIKDKIKNVVKDRYGVEHIMHLEKYKNKVIKSGLKTKYIHNSQSCSTQQRYIHSLIGGELNYPIDNISLDIALPNEKVYIEYNGSGHDLDVKLGKISERDFKYKEIRRYKYLKSLGWKQIEINSPKDLLPDDNTIIHLINNAITNILNNNCNHITININENTFDNLRKIKSSTINLN